MLDSCNIIQKQSEELHTFQWDFFPSLKHNFIAYRSSKMSSGPDCIFEIPQLWQSGFSRVYSNCCCSCWFEPEIIKISQSSHKIYSNNILNFQESTTILNSFTKKKRLETYCMHHVCIYMTSENPLKEYSYNLFRSIMWRLSEEVGCSYEVPSWNKFIIAHWQSVQILT